MIFAKCLTKTTMKFRAAVKRRALSPLGGRAAGLLQDEEKTAKTFKTIGGVRYSIPGDYCLVAEDGTLTLLGRGSVCINSAGEKIYPEEWKKPSNCMTAWKTRWLSVCRTKNGVRP